MASYFGEIKPLTSRAVDDEEADNQPKYVVSIENTEENARFNLNVKLMIVSVGKMASIFVKSHFLSENYVLASTIKCSCEGSENESIFYTGLKSSKDFKNIDIATIFASNAGVLICNVSSSVPEEVCHETTEMIFKTFSPEQVLILTSQHMASFKSSSSYDTSFLKALSTSQYTANQSCSISRLDSPNFLSNMPASLLLKSEITKLPALCVVNFVDTNSIDSLNVGVFGDILKEAVVSRIPVNQDAKSRVIKFVKAKLSSESNLYT